MFRETVLFLCTGNSARSQMAEGLLRHHGGPRFRAYSAGLDPKPVHPLAVEVMREIGIDITMQRSKGVEAFLGQVLIHKVIVVCNRAARHCPRIWPGVHQMLYWPFEDPVAAKGSRQERLATFREVRDQIDAQIRTELIKKRPPVTTP